MALFAPDKPNPEHNRRRTDGIVLSIIARDLTITGDLAADGVVRVEGRIQGTIRAASQILVAPGAVVQGNLFTREAIVAGEVQGTITAGERVELQATANVTGDVVTPRIAMLEGCRLSGEIKMDPPPGAPGAKPAVTTS